MKENYTKILKFFITSIFLMTFLTSCSTYHKNITGSNDFHSLVSTLVDKASPKLKKYIHIDDIVLVSDFVNLDKLTNKSKLGFLLSDHLKNSLLSENILVKEIELSKNFQYGKHGLNILTRDQKDISNKLIDNKFAVVGTYTVTTESLIVFIKLIDTHTGNILSSANGRTSIDEEILELEKENKQRRIVVIPPMVL